MRRFIIFGIVPLFILVSSISCLTGQRPVPKPKGYFRITLPEKKYQMYLADAPYSFEYPVYSVIKNDKDKNAEFNWINIHFKDFNAAINVSYKSVNNNINELLEDSRTLVYKHTIKAEGIEENIFVDSVKKVYGTLYDIKGNSASSVQFFLTDSSKHFFRGALYFNVPPNKDSLSPVIDFIRKDIVHLIESFEWK